MSALSAYGEGEGMSEARHTSGPYRGEGPDPFGDYTIVEADGSLAIAAVISNLRESDEVEANALLFTAAPELLEAAKDAEKHLRNLIDGTTHITCEGCREDIFQATQWLGEAIDKAEGKGKA